MHPSIACPRLAPGLAVALAVVLAGGCASNETGQRANRWMEPGSIVGQPSEQWDVPARLARGRSPVYPIGQLLEGRSSRAEVGFTVGIDGRTKDIRVVQADREVFGRHLAIAVRDWQFEPAQRNGIPVVSTMTVAMDFSIQRNFDAPLSPEDRRQQERARR